MEQGPTASLGGRAGPATPRACGKLMRQTRPARTMGMVDWQMLEGIGGVATAIAVIIAVTFGILQFRQMETQRRQAATQHYLASVSTPQVVNAVQRLLKLPDDAPPEMIASDPQLRQELVYLDWAMEGAGLFVYNRAADLHDVDRIMGGFTRGVWRKVRRYVEAERADWPNFGEWWQWLVERMDEDPAPGKREGAHVAFRSWRR